MARKHLLWIWKFQCYSDRIDGMQRQELEVLERMMGNENANQMNFFSEMSEYQITAGDEHQYRVQTFEYTSGLGIFAKR